MAFTVEFSTRAIRDIDEIAAYIQSDSPVEATRWRQRLLTKMDALYTMPEGCGFAPESDFASREIRQLHFGRYRVLFHIRDRAVFIISVRHSSRRLMRDIADNLD